MLLITNIMLTSFINLNARRNCTLSFHSDCGKPFVPGFYFMRANLIGKVFGHLTVIKFFGIKNQRTVWECKCVCGKITYVDINKLNSGHTKSCGCFKPHKTHGKSGLNRSKEYIAWDAMIQRCCNPNNPNYKYYGAKGVKVCDRWKNSFENFLSDMGEAPSPKHSLDRKETTGSYEPNKCRWSTRIEQDRNKRRNRYLTYNGKRLIISDWASELGVCAPTINYHLSKGKSFDWVYNYFKNKKSQIA